MAAADPYAHMRPPPDAINPYTRIRRPAGSTTHWDWRRQIFRIIYRCQGKRELDSEFVAAIKDDKKYVDRALASAHSRITKETGKVPWQLTRYRQYSYEGREWQKKKKKISYKKKRALRREFVHLCTAGLAFLDVSTESAGSSDSESDLETGAAPSPVVTKRKLVYDPGYAKRLPRLGETDERNAGNVYSALLMSFLKSDDIVYIPAGAESVAHSPFSESEDESGKLPPAGPSAEAAGPPSDDSEEELGKLSPPPPPPGPEPNVVGRSEKQNFIARLLMTMFRFGGKEGKKTKTLEHLIFKDDVYIRGPALLAFVEGYPKLFSVANDAPEVHRRSITKKVFPSVIPSHDPKWCLFRPQHQQDITDTVADLLRRVSSPDAKVHLGFDTEGWQVGSKDITSRVPFCDGVRIVQLYDPAEALTNVIVLPKAATPDHASRRRERAFLDATGLTALLRHPRIIKHVHGNDNEKFRRCYNIECAGFVDLHSVTAAISMEVQWDLVLGPNLNSLAVACDLPMPRYCKMEDLPGVVKDHTFGRTWDQLLTLKSGYKLNEMMRYCSYDAESSYFVSLHLSKLRPSPFYLDMFGVDIEDLPPV